MPTYHEASAEAVFSVTRRFFGNATRPHTTLKFKELIENVVSYACAHFETISIVPGVRTCSRCTGAFRMATSQTTTADRKPTRTAKHLRNFRAD